MKPVGLLSRLPFTWQLQNPAGALAFGEQQGLSWSAPEAAPAQAAQPPSAPPQSPWAAFAAPAQQHAQQRQQQQRARPVAGPQAQALEPLSTQAAPLDATPTEPMPQASPMTWGERFQGLANLPNSPFFALGTNLLAASQRGGDWGLFNQGMQAWGQQQMQRRTLDNAERRADAQERRDTEQWSWMRDERGRTAERRQLAQQYIASRPASEQAELRMIDPDTLGDYLQRSRQIGIQERGMDLQVQQLAQDARQHRENMGLGYARLQSDRLLNSAQQVLGREEAARLGVDMQRLRGWSLIDNDLGALEEILQRNPAAFNNLLDADVEQALARIRDPQTRRDVQTIYSVATSMAREELRGQTPVSNIDLLSAVRGAPSPSSGAGFARDWINRAYQDRSDLEGYVQGALQYMQQPDGSMRSLYEPDPATGRNFYQGDTFRRYTRDGNQSFSDVAGGRGGRGGASNDAQAAAEELRRREGGGVGGGAGGSAGFGTLGGRAGAPRLLREPNAYEATIVRQYEEAARGGSNARTLVLERRLRQRGLIP